MKHKLLLLGLCSAAVLSPGNAVGQIDVNWSALSPGDTSRELEPELYMRFDSTTMGCIVDSTTDPANPFENLGQSLHVISDFAGAPRFEAFFRAFPESAARQGSFSMQFRIVSGTLTLEAGHTPNMWDPVERTTYGMEENYFGVLFQPGSEIQIRGIPVQSSSVLTIEPNVNYTFSIKWDFEASEAVYTFFLNDEPIHVLSGTPYVRVAEPAEVENGVTGFRILMGTRETAEGEVFIGRLQSVLGGVDLQE